MMLTNEDVTGRTDAFGGLHAARGPQVARDCTR